MPSLFQTPQLAGTLWSTVTLTGPLVAVTVYVALAGAVREGHHAKTS